MYTHVDVILSIMFSVLLYVWVVSILHLYNSALNIDEKHRQVLP